MRPTFLREYVPALLLVATSLFLSAPFLFFGKAFSGEEHVGFYYAISFWVHQSLELGTPLLWQGAYYGGVSASLDQFVGAFYPINQFLFSILPFFIAHHLSIFFATTLGLLLTYWFGRVQGWGRVASLIFALAYLSATSYSWLSIGTIAAHSFAMLPALVLTLWYVAHKGTTTTRIAFFVLWGSIALGVGMLSGFMQIIFYNFCIAGAYALFLDWSHYKKGSGVLYTLRTSVSYALMTVGGFCIGIWQFFPSASLISLTIRTSDYAIQAKTYATPLELIAFFIPPYTEIPFLVSGGQSPGFYIGAVGLLFACIALTHYRNKTTIFFAALYLLIAAFGFHLPLFGWLNDHVPPFSHMGGSLRWMVAAAFPLAFLAGKGVDGFLRDPMRLSARGWKLYLSAIGLVVFLGVLGSVLLTVLVRHITSSSAVASRIIEWYGTIHPLSRSSEMYVPVLNVFVQKLGAFFSLTSVHYIFTLACFAILLMWMFYERYVPSAHRFAALSLTCMMLVTVGVSFALQWRWLSPQSLYTATPALVSELTQREKDPHAYRIMGYLIGDGVYEHFFGKEPLTGEENTRLQLELLINNSNIYWGIERMDGLEPYRTLRANQLLNTVVGHDYAAFAFDDAFFKEGTPELTKLYNRSVQKQVTHEEKLVDLVKRLPLISMMNVRYLYSLYPLKHESLVPITLQPLVVRGERIPVYLYENTNALPRVYMAQRANFVSGSDSEVLAHMIGVTDFSRETVIECGMCDQVSGGGTVSVVRYAPGTVELTVTSERGGFVTLSESYLPGWTASVDGEESPIYKTNYLFQSVYVGPGTHHVAFVYHDITMLELGSLLSRI